MAAVAESLGPLERALFWVATSDGKVPSSDFFSLVGGVLEAGGRLVRSGGSVVWQLPSGLEAVTVGWRWSILLPESSTTSARERQSHVIVRGPFGQEWHEPLFDRGEAAVGVALGVA